ncbi:hypothetical protein [Aliarcobacter vitoriensis]|uniref:DUF1330 domain-containing protein n=1 Tax=Aliarcobacter vitoriensis TaxID=2011099 RepID=A0A366MVE6_9BACT|nr:hypothetical protein [Aliarcobacter vitoriensis]RBQ29580.1 hypothetical protein CRU91_02965 [Aliarcobacter vitoriensis]
MPKAFLEITLNIKPENRATAAGVYTKYKETFLNEIMGAKSKDLLVRDEDVQVLHGFECVDSANAYLKSALFENDVVRELSPLFESAPDIRIYTVA